MGKDPEVRIDDTIAFIRTATVPGPNTALRNMVADMLRDRNNAGTIPFTASPAMSQGHNFAVFNRAEVKETRHYRRAIILIRMVLENVDNATAPAETAQLPDANLPAALGNCLGQVDATVQDLTAKLALLKTNPLSFLTNNNLQMMSARATGVTPYIFVHDEGADQYKLVPPASGNNLVAVDVNVFHLPVVAYASLNKLYLRSGGQAIAVPGHDVVGADLMVTTQLTGCSIVYYHGAAGLVAAHVQPVGIAAETLCADLRNMARLIGAPGQAVTGVFGAQAAMGGNVNNYVPGGKWNFCLGVHTGGAWSLYAQQRPKSHLPGARTAWQIV